MALSKLERLLAQTLGHDPKAKKEFATEAKRKLHHLASTLGLETGDYEVRYDPSYEDSSGVAVLHADHLYVQIAQSFSGNHPVMYRTCNGRQDFFGHQNHFTDIKALTTRIETFADELSLFALHSRSHAA